MGGKRRIDWGQVQGEVARALEEFSRQGVKPTLRAIFYWLVSKEVLPNTKSAYKGLSAHMVKWRQKGIFAWDCLLDTEREVKGYLSDSELNEDALKWWVEDTEDLIEGLTLEDVVKKLLPWEPSFSFGRWAGQPTVPVLWVEKKALAQILHSWTEDLAVPIRVGRGYPSWTFIYASTEALKEVLARHERVMVLYLGDLDYSGVDIQRFLREALEYFGLPEERVILKRIAITEDQVERYGLPPRPEDAETLEKLAKDPRRHRYELKYVVELDALLAYAPSAFKELVRKAILDLWDKETYEKLKARQEELRQQLEREKSRLVQALRDKLIEIATEPTP